MKMIAPIAMSAATHNNTIIRTTQRVQKIRFENKLSIELQNIFNPYDRRLSQSRKRVREKL
jgi:hypothetical protein